jgi:hypothetical protein
VEQHRAPRQRHPVQTAVLLVHTPRPTPRTTNTHTHTRTNAHTPVPPGSPSSLLRALPATLNAQQLWLAVGSLAPAMCDSACAEGAGTACVCVCVCVTLATNCNSTQRLLLFAPE